MNENRTEAIDALREWSKWLITLGTGAAGGCVLVLKGGVSSTGMRLALFAAVFFFAATVFCSVILCRELVRVMESADPTPTLWEQRVRGGHTVGGLANFQTLTLLIATLCFGGWVGKKAFDPPKPEEQKIVLTTDPKQTPLLGRIVVNLDELENAEPSQPAEPRGGTDLQPQRRRPVPVIPPGQRNP